MFPARLAYHPRCIRIDGTIPLIDRCLIDWHTGCPPFLPFWCRRANKMQAIGRRGFNQALLVAGLTTAATPALAAETNPPVATTAADIPLATGQPGQGSKGDLLRGHHRCGGPDGDHPGFVVEDGPIRGDRLGLVHGRSGQADRVAGQTPCVHCLLGDLVFCGARSQSTCPVAAGERFRAGAELATGSDAC